MLGRPVPSWESLPECSDRPSQGWESLPECWAASPKVGNPCLSARTDRPKVGNVRLSARADRPKIENHFQTAKTYKVKLLATSARSTLPLGKATTKLLSLAAGNFFLFLVEYSPADEQNRRCYSKGLLYVRIMQDIFYFANPQQEGGCFSYSSPPSKDGGY